jgi:hypothetical protein
VVAPAPGEATELDLALRLTNLGAAPVRFRLLDTVSLLVTTPAGRVLELEGGRDGIRPAPELSSPIDPGASLVVERPARLVRAERGELRMEVEDEFGSLWHLADLTPGSYRLRFRYQNIESSSPESGPVWTGRVISPEKEVEIR